MNAQNLADQVIATVMLAQERVGPGSIGEQQYYDAATNTQGFERMDLDDLLQYAEEEALDFINYGVMIHIRLTSLRKTLEVARAKMILDLQAEQYEQAVEQQHADMVAEGGPTHD